MNERKSPTALLFVGIGFLIVAWRLTPEPDWHLNSKIFVGFIAVSGAICVISAIIDGGRRTNLWWQGLAGQLGVAVGLWLLIAVASWHYGTPHMLLEYPVGQSGGRCVYFGWRGVVVAPGVKAQTNANGCTALLWLYR